MPNEGNNGAVKFVSALRKITAQQIPKERTTDFGELRADYSLVMDSYPVPIPRGEWSVARHLLSGASPLKPGDRVVAAWVGNEAIVIGCLAKM